MLLTFKIKLELNDIQKGIIDSMSNDSRKLYNHFLGKLKDEYELNKKFISYYKQQSELKDYITEYLTFDSKKEVLRTLHSNYSSFFRLIKKDNTAKSPRFRGEKYFFTLSFIQDFIISGNNLRISYSNYRKLDINLNYIKPIEDLICNRNKSKSQIKQLKIYKEENIYYASITYEKTELKPFKTDNILSIDLGKKNLLTTYNPKTDTGIVYNSKYLSKNQKYHDKRIDELKSKRDIKVKHSNKFKQLNKKIKYVQNKKKNQTNLILHKTSKDLSDYTIILGELTNIKKAIKTNFRKLNRQMLNNWNLATFVHLLEYKCKLKGNQVIKVNEAWTSKTCCKCGDINHDLSLSDRQYICECGNDINRDVNSAINIYKQHLGDYNTPLVVNSTERFDWCNINQMNKIYS